MKRVIIIGGDISSLLCAHVFSKYKNVEVIIVGMGKVGDEFLNGGIKYVQKTKRIVELFEEFDLNFSSYSIKAGIMLKGSICSYPQCLQDFSKNEVERIKADYYRKTRLSEPENITIKKAMNDPESTRPKKAIRTDFESFVYELTKRVDIRKDFVFKITDKYIFTDRTNRFEYDFLVLTLPLWKIKPIINLEIPRSVAVIKNSICIEAKKQRYLKYDLIYTPYTPADCVYKIVTQDEKYIVESSGSFSKSKFISDLNFLFSDGWWIKDALFDIEGYMLPIKQKPEWPRNIAPLGKFAKWDSRVTVDSTLDEIFDIAKRWFGGEKRR